MRTCPRGHQTIFRACPVCRTEDIDARPRDRREAGIKGYKRSEDRRRAKAREVAERLLERVRKK